MTPEQAIQLLDRITSNIPLVRADQNAVVTALKVLNDLVQAGKVSPIVAPKAAKGV